MLRIPFNGQGLYLPLDTFDMKRGRGDGEDRTNDQSITFWLCERKEASEPDIFNDNEETCGLMQEANKVKPTKLGKKLPN